MGRVMIIGAISLAILFMAATVCSSRIMTITISEDAENPQTQSCQQQIQQVLFYFINHKKMTFFIFN